MTIPITIQLENGVGNGRLFAQQRLLVLQLIDRVESDYERALLEGLTSLLDEIADQAHDKYGVDCLIKIDEELEPTSEVVKDY